MPEKYKIHVTSYLNVWPHLIILVIYGFMTYTQGYTYLFTIVLDKKYDQSKNVLLCIAIKGRVVFMEFSLLTLFHKVG